MCEQKFNLFNDLWSQTNKNVLNGFLIEFVERVLINFSIVDIKYMRQGLLLAQKIKYKI